MGHGRTPPPPSPSPPRGGGHYVYLGSLTTNLPDSLMTLQVKGQLNTSQGKKQRLFLATYSVLGGNSCPVGKETELVLLSKKQVLAASLSTVSEAPRPRTVALY